MIQIKLLLCNKSQRASQEGKNKIPVIPSKVPGPLIKYLKLNSFSLDFSAYFNWYTSGEKFQLLSSEIVWP